MNGTAETIAVVAAMLGVAGAAAQTHTSMRIRSAGTGALLVAWIGLLASIVPHAIAQRWPALAVAGVVALAAAWFAGPWITRHARWMLTLAGAAAIYRVPVPTGDGTASLLLPIYLVVGLGTVAVVRAAIERRRDPSSDGRVVDRGWATRTLDVAVALQTTLASASILWSVDRASTAQSLAFFFVPFLLGYLLLRRWVRTNADVRGAVIGLLLAVGVAALVGLVQAVTHHVWWNPKVIDANRFRGDFRTNSLFWDPNIFGRSLVYGVLVLVALAVTGRADVRRRIALAVGAVVLLGALWITYSQSSWFALAAALAVLGVLTLPPQLRRWATAAILIACIASTPAALHQLRGRDADGRRDVVEQGVDLAKERPVLGWGAGAFETAAIEHAHAEGKYNERLTASHTSPITIAAETGAIGLGAYALLLAAAVATALARWRRSSTPAAAARARGDDDAGPGWPVAPVVWSTAALVALVAHSLLYAAFFEDPLLWAALALLASLPTVDENGRPLDFQS